MRAGLRHARDRGPQRTDAPMQLPCGYLVRMDSCSSRKWRSPQGLRRFLSARTPRCRRHVSLQGWALGTAQIRMLERSSLMRRRTVHFHSCAPVAD